MKRSFSFSTALTVGAITLLTAVPALAQEYTYDYSTDDPAAALAGMGIWAFCCMIPMLLLAVFNIWMLVDAIMRQEHEYPNSTGTGQCSANPRSLSSIGPTPAITSRNSARCLESPIARITTSCRFSLDSRPTESSV
jgi:hypothetical protein